MNRDIYPKYQLPSGNWTTDQEHAERLWAKHEAKQRTLTRGGPEAVASVRRMLAAIGDDRERCLVQMVLDTCLEGGKLPSWPQMSPLMRVAALTLQGKQAPSW